MAVIFKIEITQEYKIKCIIINEKEEKLNQIDKLIKDKELGIKNEVSSDSKKTYEFDYNIIDLLNETKYQDQSLFELNKKIPKNAIRLKSILVLHLYSSPLPHFN